MKRKIVMALLIMSMIASVFSGCGNRKEEGKVQTAIADTGDSQEGTVTQTDGTDTAEVQSVVEPTVQPTTEPAPTAEPTPEPTPDPSPEQMPEQKQVVTDEWAVNLYNALVKDDYKKVIELLGDISNAMEKCAPYEDEDWSTWENETAYSMLMEDGETMTITISDWEEEGLGWEIWAFVMYDRESGLIAKGDHCVHLNDDGTYAYIKDGNEVISADPGQLGFVFDDEWTSWMGW